MLFRQAIQKKVQIRTKCLITEKFNLEIYKRKRGNMMADFT